MCCGDRTSIDLGAAESSEDSLARRRVSRRTLLSVPLALGAVALVSSLPGLVNEAQALTCGGWGYNDSERWCTCGTCSNGMQQRQCWYVYNRWCCDGFGGCWLQYWYISGSCLSGSCGPCSAYLGDGC